MSTNRVRCALGCSQGWPCSFSARSAGPVVTAGGSTTVTAGSDRLAGIDHDILALLDAYRVLTTPQLITLTRRPGRTVDYRLALLRSRRLVDRTRSYAASGSAALKTMSYSNRIELRQRVAGLR